MINLTINPHSVSDYEAFLKCKRLPSYQVKGREIITDERSYNLVFGGENSKAIYPSFTQHLFDYQDFITATALERRRFAAFLDCGLGKTRIEISWSFAVAEKYGKVLFLAPLAVIEDIQKEAVRMTGSRLIDLRKGEQWKEGVALMNYEGMRDIDMRGAVGICLDESSILKNGDGKIRKYLQGLATFCDYRLACSATPSPNDQSEYATHAAFLGITATLKEFYARFFRKEGTDWILKPHAEQSFYGYMKTWACYLYKPSDCGFQPGGEMTEDPERLLFETSCEGYSNGKLFNTSISLSEAGRIFSKLRSDKSLDRFRQSIERIQGKRAIVWCARNDEEAAFASELKNVALINGSTPIEKRVDLINGWRSGHFDTLVSKPKVLGFGVNLPEATDMLFSGYDFSFERWYQAERRAHRYGRTGRLRVHIPLTEPEYPIWQTIDAKLKTFKSDIQKLQTQFFNNAN